MNRRGFCSRAGGCALLLAALGAVAGAQVVPEAVPDLPVLGVQAPRGGGLALSAAPVTKSAPKIVDGQIDDWIGVSTRFAGTAVYSAGEYVYQDYLMDDWGADDGQDAQRVAITDPLAETEPRTYRVEALSQALRDQFGAEGPESLAAEIHYGDSGYPEGLEHHADIAEARIAADAEKLYFLIRTTVMGKSPGTAVLILLDTEEGGSYPAPGGITTAAEIALLAAGNAILSATEKGLPLDLCPGCASVATNPAGFTNAVEIGIDRSVLPSLLEVLRVGMATGVVDASRSGLASVRQGDAKSDLFNVAFRFSEPERIRMDHDQALALFEGDLDRFLAPVDLARLVGGSTEGFEPRPGYYERVFLSSSPVVEETTQNGGHVQGVYQAYGVYLPSTYRQGTPSPATLWLHYSGGRAHDAAAWVPGLLRQLGEDRGNILVSPSGRGISNGFVGRGHVDVLETLEDAMASFSIDPDRVYLSGYSMGGFGSYLFGLLYPDRFAAAFPTVGPVTAGAPGLFGLSSGGEEVLSLANLLENARNLPYVIYHGTNDEIVPVTEAITAAVRLTELGYRHRFDLFPGYEHFTFAVVDEWTEAISYLDRFRRDANPPRVTYRVWPALERLVETEETPTTLDFDLDGAYWVDGLSVREGDLGDPATIGTFDGETLGRGSATVLPIPDSGAGVQSTPFVQLGWQWIDTARVPPQNRFRATLTNLTTARLDLLRMGLSTTTPLEASIETDGEAELLLAGSWETPPTVSGASEASLEGGILRLQFVAGTHAVTITP